MIRCSLVVLLAVALPVKAAESYTVKQVDSAPPQELKEPVRKLLADKGLQFLDDKATVLCECWFRKEVPSKATAEQVKNGLTYRELEASTLLGAIRLPKTMTDYRKQKIKAGTYTLRLGFQPENGDHMGTAPFNEFCLLAPASEDKDPAPLSVKALQEMSEKASGTSHPGVLLLFPVTAKEAEGGPTAVNKGEGHWILLTKCDVQAGNEKTVLGIGLTLVGVSSAA
jgi:hypothetical protein